ncbi:hypothetical protein [uncultured Amnibacterium sp.]|uniref:SbtR family transcriptional regulator n=1 Tax=uncultured Amnibacterium sp. TaxID=1631851 RepID=UPI0035CC1676
MARTNRAVGERSGVAITPSLERLLLSAWGELVQRAHEEGSVRHDFTAADVPLLFAAAAAIASAVDYDEQAVERYVALLMDGLRPSRTDLPGRPLSQAELRKAFNSAPSR